MFRDRPRTLLHFLRIRCPRRRHHYVHSPLAQRVLFGRFRTIPEIRHGRLCHVALRWSRKPVNIESKWRRKQSIFQSIRDTSKIYNSFKAHVRMYQILFLKAFPGSFLIFVVSIQVTVIMFYKNANARIRTWDIRCWRKLLQQLYHTQCRCSKIFALLENLLI